MEAHFLKLPNGALVPATDDDRQLIDKIKAGSVVRLKYTRMRNYQFFKKWHALLRFAYDSWEPAELPEDPESRWMKNITPEKNYDCFRDQIIVLSGYYKSYFTFKGCRVEADSVSFANMDEDTFEKLYSKTIDVILKQIYADDTMDERTLRNLVDQAMSFA